MPVFFPEEHDVKEPFKKNITANKKNKRPTCLIIFMIYFVYMLPIIFIFGKNGEVAKYIPNKTKITPTTLLITKTTFIVRKFFNSLAIAHFTTSINKTVIKINAKKTTCRFVS